ncbi:MAG: hypothetical protein AAF802_00015 [Planctomycetota bacterium]
MDPLDECSILIPSSTLEDLPTGLSAADARSLLAGWTVLWHPRLLARTGQSPTWYRADSPPPPDGKRVVTVPAPAREQVPAEFRRKCETNPACSWVEGASRTEMLDALGLPIDEAGNPTDPSLGPIHFESRTIEINDFFAAGYLILQIQIMTRRLRYTSNLDELYLQSRIVAAANAFVAREASECAEAMHDVFDCLSEERDHYFSSDPHLIDLTLLTPQVLDRAIEGGWDERLRQHVGGGDEGNGVLPTPANLLIDSTVANAINETTQSDVLARLRALVALPEIGWAGGGVPSSHDAAKQNESDADHAVVAMGLCTQNEAGVMLRRSQHAVSNMIGEPPAVFGQLTGHVPSDLIGLLSKAGYKGVIPIDFLNGTGFGDESKVKLGNDGDEIEALVAKPIDAADDSAFLTIGAELGEAIDGGEVATGLFVHWPDRSCDGFGDLQRATSWCVALGKFWTLDRYFVDGERPYHTGSVDAVSKQSVTSVVEAIQSSSTTLQQLASSFCTTVRSETDTVACGIAKLANPKLLHQPLESDDATVAAALGVEKSSREATEPKPNQAVIFNPHAVAVRENVTIFDGAPSKRADFVFATSPAAGHDSQGSCEATFDIPAFGIGHVGASDRLPKQRLLQRLLKRGGSIAENGVLRNQFMAVSLSDESGSIAGVYSASRGNRFSMRLIRGASSQSASDPQSSIEMICAERQILQGDPATGRIRVAGELIESDTRVATYELDYTLRRGSRIMTVCGSITPLTGSGISGDSDQADFWSDAISWRFAVAEESAIFRPLVRDRVQSSPIRQMAAPLGVLIDEAEKQTLVCGHGLPLFRRVGARFLDMPIGTLQEASRFQLSLAFDAPQPVALARSLLAGPKLFPQRVAEPRSDQAWLVHCSAKDVVITNWAMERRSDGKLTARITLVQTRPRATSVRLEFCIAAKVAFRAGESGIERSLEELPSDVTCDGGVVNLRLASHEAADLIVVFDV